ncbi:MAG: L-threonylcarbamoyladenylate synthase [Flavobacteriaceae bacterium]
MITTDLELVINSLKRGEIVSIPTETVYGLAGNALKEESVNLIFNLKKRPAFNPLIVHIADVNFLDRVAENIPDQAKLLANHFWPGPLTLILKKKALIPNRVTAGKDTLAVRVPNHPLTIELLKKLPFPLAAPSANPFGSISPTTARHVYKYFEEKVPFILDGGSCKSGLESTIIGFENDTPVLYRHGALALEKIIEVIGPVKELIKNDQNPKAPGMLSKHYAPQTETIRSENILETIANYPNKKIGILSFQKIALPKDITHQEILSKMGNLEEAARNLYAALHRLDQLQLELIVVPYFPNHGLGKTINDRLQRAIQK